MVNIFKKSKMVGIIPVVVITIVIGIGVFMINAFNHSVAETHYPFDWLDQCTEHPDFPINALGYTYGSSAWGGFPDLVRVEATNRRIGYVFESDGLTQIGEWRVW